MSGGSVGPLLIPANYVGCLSANQMTGTFLPSPAPYTSATAPTHTRTRCTAPKCGLELWPQHCIVGHRNIAMQGQSSEKECNFDIFNQSLCAVRGCYWVPKSKFWIFPFLHKSKSFLNSGE